MARIEQALPINGGEPRVHEAPVIRKQVKECRAHGTHHGELG
jgi:hypothetical protein